MVEAVSTNVPFIAPQRDASGDSAVLPGTPAPQDQQAVSASARERQDPKTDDFDERTLDRIAARLVAPDSRLAISQDNFIRRFIYKFVDRNNGDVIRQYPHERVVQSMHALEEMRERFLDEEV